MSIFAKLQLFILTQAQYFDHLPSVGLELFATGEYKRWNGLEWNGLEWTTGMAKKKSNSLGQLA